MWSKSCHITLIVLLHCHLKYKQKQFCQNSTLFHLFSCKEKDVIVTLYWF